MRRLPNYESALHEVIRSHRGEPFAYGSHDCGILVADAVQVQIGTDIAIHYRGQYNTRAELDQLLASRGYKTHIDILADLFEEIHYSMAVTGDVAAVQAEDGTEVTGVIMGPYIFLYGLRGVGALPLDRAVRTFRVEIR